MNADHPSWCDPSECTAGEPNGAHRSTPIIISPVSIALHALAATPETVLIEIRCDATTLRPRVAYTVGRALVQLGKQANKIGNGDGRE